jgi:hypothetical protein
MVSLTFRYRSLRAVSLTVAVATGLWAQTDSQRNNDAIESLRAQIQELKSGFEQVKSDLAASRRESDELRRQVQALRERMGAPAETAAIEARMTALEEQEGLTAGKVDDQYQSKVQSGSRYQLRLSGMVLFNAATTRGAVDHLDVPAVAESVNPGDSRGSSGASLRQSQIGMDVLGPDFLGAKLRGDIHFDFFGGFPSSTEGVTAGLLRLRTGGVSLDWKNTTLVAGQESPFFSPLSPTSLVSTAYPAFSSAGNLWTWTPQVFVEHRIAASDESRFSFRAGVLDALTGELPASEYRRLPTSGERSRTPALAARVGWQRNGSDQLAFGIGTYLARQDWTANQSTNAWAVTADWNVPFGRWFRWSGEAYRGTAIGGLGGSPNASVLSWAPTPSEVLIIPIVSTGGWSQLKFQPSLRWQFNAAFGQDYSSGDRLDRSFDPYVRRNATSLFNFIYQARANLLLSAEYRHFYTLRSVGDGVTADHVSVGAGILF